MCLADQSDSRAHGNISYIFNNGGCDGEMMGWFMTTHRYGVTHTYHLRENICLKFRQITFR